MPLCLSAEELCNVLHSLQRSDHHHTDLILTRILVECLAAVESHCSEHTSELPINKKIVHTLGEEFVVCNLCVSDEEVLHKLLQGNIYSDISECIN